MEKEVRVEVYCLDLTTQVTLPFADEGISAGFPSPAQDYIKRSIDLNEELIENPSATFLGRIVGDCLEEIGATNGSIAIIDCSRTASNGDLVVVFLDGEFTMKYLEIMDNRQKMLLHPRNKGYKPIEITPEQTVQVWGVVTRIVIKPPKFVKGGG